jgi:hypothetical protein
MSEQQLCIPIRRLLEKLGGDAQNKPEIKLSDYHFKEYHLRVKGKFDAITFDETQFESQGHKLICKCHWSVLEFLEE